MKRIPPPRYNRVKFEFLKILPSPSSPNDLHFNVGIIRYLFVFLTIWDISILNASLRRLLWSLTKKINSQLKVKLFIAQPPYECTTFACLLNYINEVINRQWYSHHTLLITLIYGWDDWSLLCVTILERADLRKVLTFKQTFLDVIASQDIPNMEVTHILTELKSHLSSSAQSQAPAGLR